MNLGSLVTISSEAPQNLHILLFDNGVYEVTGAQLTPGSSGRRSDEKEIDYCELARACGFQAVYSFDQLDDWRDSVKDVLSQLGPSFVHLKVAPIPGAVGPKSPGPAKARADAFVAALRQNT